MDAGKLDKRIGVYGFSKVSDGAGGYKNTKALEKSIWAKVSFEKSLVDAVEGKTGNLQTIKVVVRKRTADSVDIGDVMNYNGGDYKINSKKPIEIDFWEELTASKID